MPSGRRVSRSGVYLAWGRCVYTRHGFDKRRIQWMPWQRNLVSFENPPNFCKLSRPHCAHLIYSSCSDGCLGRTARLASFEKIEITNLRMLERVKVAKAKGDFELAAKLRRNILKNIPAKLGTIHAWRYRVRPFRGPLIVKTLSAEPLYDSNSWSAYVHGWHMLCNCTV